LHQTRKHNWDVNVDPPPPPKSGQSKLFFGGREEIFVDDEKQMDAIAECFAVHSLSRIIFESPLYQKVHAKSTPKGYNRVEDLNTAIRRVYVRQFAEVCKILCKTLSTMETDGWKSFGKDWISFLVSGRFYKTVQYSDREFKTKIVELLKELLADLEKNTGTILIGIVSDNCGKITLPLMEVSSKQGFLVLRCTPQSFNLVLTDLWSEDPVLTALNRKIVAITRLIMNNKAYSIVFKNKQEDWLRSLPEPSDRKKKKPGIRVLNKVTANRWSSRGSCWERFLELIKPVQSTLAELKLTWRDVAEYVQNMASLLQDELTDSKMSEQNKKDLDRKKKEH
jgi:hypothetical protein